MTLTFDAPINNGFGDDLVVFENGFFSGLGLFDWSIEPGRPISHWWGTSVLAGLFVALMLLALQRRELGRWQDWRWRPVLLAFSDETERRELQEVIATYHAGHVPLVVPVTLLRRHVRRHDVEYLAQQSYLDPHPTELMLRSHV